MMRGAQSVEADDGEYGGGEEDHEEGDGDGGLELIGIEFEEDGAGEDLGFHSVDAGEDVDRTEFAERTRPREREGGDHAEPSLRESDAEEGLQAAEAVGHGT